MQKIAVIEQFDVTVGEEAHFGHGGRKLVNLIETSSPLETIEQEFRALLRGLDAWIVDETTKVLHGFRPHITVQTTGRVHQGDSFICDNLYIVEQKGGHKEIVSRIHL